MGERLLSWATKIPHLLFLRMAIYVKRETKIGKQWENNVLFIIKRTGNLQTKDAYDIIFLK